MMDIFSNMAFPAAACIAMGYYVKYITDKHFEERRELENKHEQAEGAIKEAINNNTIVMTKICERIGNESVNDGSNPKDD